MLVTHGRADWVVLPAMPEHVLATCAAAEPPGAAPPITPHLEAPERFNRELAELTLRVRA